jgi:hypothetical protein
MLTKAALAATALVCSAAGGAELQPYRVTVVEQIRHDITVEANADYSARTIALLEARRTSTFDNPAWRPSPPAVFAHTHEVGDFSVVNVEPLFQLDASEVAAP